MSSPQAEPPYGFLRSCIDKRFVEATRRAFEERVKTDLHLPAFDSTSFWHEAYAGGSAKAPPGFPDGTSDGEAYSAAHGATIFGWQAHISLCGGFPPPPPDQDPEIRAGLRRTFERKQAQYPRAVHYMILAKQVGTDGVEFEITVAMPS